MKKARIGDLPSKVAGAAVYRRDNGDTYIRLNKAFHVKGKQKPSGGGWLGDGMAEKIDLDELVEVIETS